jgi:[ribosomal protein S18]-alanine N-acetyltransferase
MRIKKIEKSSIADLIRIAEEVNLSHWSADSYIEEMKNPASIMFRLEGEANETVGFIVGRMIEGGTLEPVPEAEIYNIAVIETEQNGGLGQLLFDHFLEMVRQNNGKSIWLEVRESNEKAIGFYRKNGFEKVQTRNHFYENPREHALLMRLVIQ